MEPIEGLIKARVQKLESLKKAGINPYPARFKKTTPIDESKKLDSDVVVAGRIMSLRPHGKIVFADLVDHSGQIQLLFKQDSLKNFEHVDFLDNGDFVGVEGKVFKTNAGEITVEVASFTVLAKSLRPLPSTWYGLKDVETRYRKRYLDLLLNEEVKKIAVARSKIISSVRKFLDDRGFLEVETPSLQPVYGGANARPFKTHHNALDADFYLKISDELYLKRLIVAGLPKVYEIDKDFRNEGVDKTHNPEFTMMECYQAYADYHDMMDLTEDLYQFAAKETLGTTEIGLGDKKINFSKKWERITMYDAIKRYLGIDVQSLSDEEIKDQLKKYHLKYEGNPTLTGVGVGFVRGIAIATLFEAVEPHLIEPTFITDLPKETTSLCKPKEDNPDLIERFEGYINGWEVANAYSELNDPVLQKEFFLQQVEAKLSGDEEAHPMDEDFIEALEYGMPPTGGLGVGIDRMVMAITGAANIREAIIFPTLRPDKKSEFLKK